MKDESEKRSETGNYRLPYPRLFDAYGIDVIRPPENASRWLGVTATGWQGVQAIGGILLLMVTAILACYAAQQWKTMSAQRDVMAAQLLASGSQYQSMQLQLATMDRTLAEIRKQTRGVMKSARAAEGQLAVAERNAQPWIGIDAPAWLPVDDFNVKSFDPLSDPQYELSLHYTVKNSGTGPGFQESEDVTWDPVPDRGIALPRLRDACLIDAFRNGKVSLHGDVGEVILPGGIKPAGIDSNMGYSDAAQTRKNLHRIWVTICVRYSDSKGIWHFSGYRYISHEPPGAVPVLIANHADWSYVPINGLSLLSADAE